MEKVYKLLDWLDMTQAVDWLQDMTETPVTTWDLLNLCDSGQCTAYLDCSGIEGHTADYWRDVVSGSGVQKVLNPKRLADIGRFAETILDLSGQVWTPDEEIGDTAKTGGHIDWRAKIQMRNCCPQFKSADIQALAAKMNGEAEPPIEHRISLPEDIRLSEQSRNKLVALAQLLNGSKIHITKSENGRFGYTVLSENGSVLIRLDENYQPCLGAVSKLFEQQLEEERAARTAAEQRAEQAETEAAKLRQVLAGNQPQESAGQPDCEPAQPATGLTFPYTTKSLEAARAAVQKYWYDFDPMRLPLQKQVKAFMVDLGVPGRQAAELAIAIKPDDPPKA